MDRDYHAHCLRTSEAYREMWEGTKDFYILRDFIRECEKKYAVNITPTQGGER